VDGTDSGQCPMTGFGISDGGPLGSATSISCMVSFGCSYNWCSCTC